MSTTEKLDLADFDPLDNGQVEFNQMTRVLDGMLHCRVTHTAFDNPTDAAGGGQMAPGVVYRVSGTPTGGSVWDGHANDFAIGAETIVPADVTTYNIAAAWNFVTPIEGFIVWMRATQNRLTFNSGGWMTPSAVANVTGANEADTVARFNTLLAKLRAHGVIAT